MNKCLHCGSPVGTNKYCGPYCQKKYQQFLKYGEIKKFKVQCHQCGKGFEVEEGENVHPEKEKYFCSRSCANTRSHSSKTKEKIRKSLIQPDTEIEKICEQCGKPFISLRRRNRRFCSTSCSATYVNLTTDRSRKGGLAAAKVQSETQRSKNEIHFAELCKGTFENVITNEQMFGIWDADVILPDQKIAVLWNGPWHYKVMWKGYALGRVQNRDKIKIKEIKKHGYTPYVIKDMGSENKKLVESEFNKFLKHL